MYSTQVSKERRPKQVVIKNKIHKREERRNMRGGKNGERRGMMLSTRDRNCRIEDRIRHQNI